MKRFLGLWMTMCACACSEVCHVEGHINGIKEKTPVTILRQIKGMQYDTITTTDMQNGNFQFDLPEKFYEEAYELQIGDLPGRPLFFAEQGDVRITGHVDSLFFARATGTRANNEWQNYRKYTQKISNQRDKALFAPGMKALNDEEQKTARSLIFKEYEKQFSHFQENFISDGQSIAALYSYWIHHLSMDADAIDRTLQKFSPRLSSNRYYVDMQKRVETLRKTAPESMAPIFSANKSNGDQISLSDLRGNYVILDFWASWCDPCRAETKHIRQLYHQFHNAGLEILSISIDDDKQAWEKAVQQDSMVWNQGLLIGENKKNVTKLYGITGIPAIWVIDPEGKIIAKNLRGEKLEAFCRQLFE